MRASLAALAFAGALLLPLGKAAAERLITTLSTSRVQVTSNFIGTDVVLFGSVEPDAQTVPRRGAYDIVVTVTGPRETVTTFRKERVFGIWVNADSRPFIKVPSYLTVLANRQINDIAGIEVLHRNQIGLARTLLTQEINNDLGDSPRTDPFRQAFLRLKIDRELYRELQNGVTLLTPSLFRASIPVPDNAPTGAYEVDVKLLARIAGTSEYHLRRLFSALAGIPLSEYIRRRKLTKAAGEVLGHADNQRDFPL